MTVPSIVLMIAIVIRWIVAEIWAVGAICIITGGYHCTEQLSLFQKTRVLGTKKKVAPVGRPQALSSMHVTLLPYMDRAALSA